MTDALAWFVLGCAVGAGSVVFWAAWLFYRHMDDEPDYEKWN